MRGWSAARRYRRLGALVGAFLVGASMLSACATCSGVEDDDLETWVDALIADSGSLANQAADVLVSRGRDAIVILETGLYRAEPEGRRRIIDVLGRIGHRDAIPILSHLAEFDPDAGVRDRAAVVLRHLHRDRVSRADEEGT